MKTSVMEVRDMLSVLSAQGVEKRIGEVPGVESATVNYAAGTATVRYDETRLDVADIKSDVRQSGFEEAAAIPAAATPKTAPVTAAARASGSAGTAQAGKAAPDAPPSSTAKPSTDAGAPAGTLADAVADAKEVKSP